FRVPQYDETQTRVKGQTLVAIRFDIEQSHSDMLTARGSKRFADPTSEKFAYSRVDLSCIY
ncbi:MAG TPA: hypothetical protein VF343_05015, partial [Syntrophales bacterium]